MGNSFTRRRKEIYPTLPKCVAMFSWRVVPMELVYVHCSVCGPQCNDLHSEQRFHLDALRELPARS